MGNQNKLDKFSKYIELVFYKTYTDLRAETERYYLGLLWWIFEPVMFMTVFYLMFGVFLGKSTEDFIPFLLIGLNTFLWTSNALLHGVEAIVLNHGLIIQAHLPKVLFPIIAILRDSIKFVFTFILLLIFLWVYGYNIGASYLSLPLVLFVQLLFTTALAFILGSIVPFLPDLRFAINTILHAWLFLSGVFFSSSQMPEKYQPYFYLNPMASLIEDYRNILMHDLWPGWSSLLTILFLSLVGIWLGSRLLARFEYVYPKITV